MSDESEADSVEESEDGAEYESTGDEFRALLTECEESRTKLLQYANRVQGRSPEAAEVVRQIAGELLPLMETVVMASGAAFEAIEQEVEETGSGEGLDAEDAVNFYRTLVADLKFIDEALVVAVGDEQRAAVDALKAMNEEMLKRVVELSDEEESDLRAQAEERPMVQLEEDAGVN